MRKPEVPEGWTPISWVRDFAQYRATVVMAKDGRAFWRCQSLADARIDHKAPAASAEEAFSEVQRFIGNVAPLIISGTGGKR